LVGPLYTVVLFVRHRKHEGGRTVAYICLGAADYVSHQGGRPIAITWRLRKPMPDDLFRDARSRQDKPPPRGTLLTLLGRRLHDSVVRQRGTTLSIRLVYATRSKAVESRSTMHRGSSGCSETSMRTRLMLPLRFCSTTPSPCQLSYRIDAGSNQDTCRYKQHVNGHILVLSGLILHEEAWKTLRLCSPWLRPQSRLRRRAARVSVVSAVRSPVETAESSHPSGTVHWSSTEQHA